MALIYRMGGPWGPREEGPRQLLAVALGTFLAVLTYMIIHFGV